jgi:ABC-2 type transport system ATP-binding protein
MILNAGKLVAEDTPQNLTARLQGYETMRLLVEGPEAAVSESLGRVPGVSNVSAMPPVDGRVEFSVQMEKGQDSRREMARAIVESGWGLLELRPVGLSLEEIFLKLTTTEETDGSPEPEAVEEPAPESSGEETTV